jgi:predicted transcriptional regulator
MSIQEKKTTTNEWSLPGEPLSQKEFEKGISEAEKGHFHTIEESKKILKEWRKKRALKK